MSEIFRYQSKINKLYTKTCLDATIRTWLIFEGVLLDKSASHIVENMLCAFMCDWPLLTEKLLRLKEKLIM